MSAHRCRFTPSSDAAVQAGGPNRRLQPFHCIRCSPWLRGLAVVLAVLAVTSTVVGSGRGATVYTQDFEAGQIPLPPEWATGVGTFGAPTGSYSSVPGFGQGYLYNDATGNPAPASVLVLTGLPAHTSLGLAFLLATIGSWDGVGTSSPYGDYFNVTVDGVSIFSEAFIGTGGTQSYVPPPGVRLTSTAYNMALEPRFQRIAHTASTVTIAWFASGVGWQGAADESWAIDSVVVAANAPGLESVTPAQAAVGDTVTFVGNDLDFITMISFNGVGATPIPVSPTTLKAVVPAGASSGPIELDWAQGTVGFPYFEVLPTPIVSRAEPDSGKIGTTVHLHGVHFTGVSGVSFGCATDAAVTVLSDTELVATVDPGAITGHVCVTGPYARGVSSFTFKVIPPDPRPQLVGVRDVPSDQGGKVFVYWGRSDLDAPWACGITKYLIWRRMPHLGVQGLAVSGAGAPEGGDGAARLQVRATASGPEYWELVGELPARFLDGYAFTAPTTQDSLPESNPYTAFFVEAEASQFEFYDSVVDSGYSVDNLAPPTPVPFAVVFTNTANELHWAASPAADLKEYQLYRGATSDFLPAAMNLVVATRDTGYVDLPGAAFYKLVAVDIHGNLSRYALASPGSPVGTLASLVSAVNEHGKLVHPDG